MGFAASRIYVFSFEQAFRYNGDFDCAAYGEVGVAGMKAFFLLVNFHRKCKWGHIFATMLANGRLIKGKKSNRKIVKPTLEFSSIPYFCLS